MLLRAAAEIVRCDEVGVAVIELWRQPRPLDLTASRRLAVAAEASGVTALMLRIDAAPTPSAARSVEHTSELQSLMRISSAVFCLKKKNKQDTTTRQEHLIHNHNISNQTTVCYIIR